MWRSPRRSCGPASTAASALATCPTYLLTGDELDGPRGRIYLIKDMLESGAPASATVARHIDRCLSCLACMTTCPSGVNYMHLVDHARRHIEETYVRPLPDRLLRRLLAAVLPVPGRFRLSLRFARLARPFAAAASGSLEDTASPWCLPMCRPLRRSIGRRSFRPRASAAPGWRCSPAAPSRC